MSYIGKPGLDIYLGKMRGVLRPGAGIDISAGTISTITPPDGVPYVAGSGIDINGATIAAALIAGYRTELISGSTIGQMRYMPIEPVTGSSVTMQAGHAYKIYATSAAVTLNTETIPANSFGLEGHLEIFTAGTGYIVTGSNVVLANALEPDAVNNCTVRFHDGIAIIAVEDHVAGYIVVNGSTSGDGSLYYGITTSTNDYVAFDASLNGTTIPLAGAVAEGEKHIVGNGYTETTLTGAVDCGTSKFTVANLTLQDVAVNGGTMTLGDANIPSGSTVAVSGGRLAIEKVTGNGGTIDLGGTYVSAGYQTSASVNGCLFTNGDGAIRGGYSTVLDISGCTFSHNNASVTGGGVYSVATVHMTDVIVTSNSAQYGGGVFLSSNTVFALSSCTVTGNTASLGQDAMVYPGGQLNLNNGNTIGSSVINGGTVSFAGSNSVDLIIAGTTAGTVVVSSGAIVDLTGNTNTTPIAPGGGITFASGGATVQLGSTAGTVESSYMMDNVTLPAGAKLTNTAVIDLGGTNVRVSRGTQAVATGCSFAGGSGVDHGGAFRVVGTLVASNCSISGCTAMQGGGIGIYSAGITELTSCVIKDNVANQGKDIYTDSGSILRLNDCEIGIARLYGGTSINGSCVIGYIVGDGTVTISSGATIDLTGNANATPIAPGGGVIVEDGGCQVITSAGSTVSIAGGTYTKINNDGTTE